MYARSSEEDMQPSLDLVVNPELSYLTKLPPKVHRQILTHLDKLRDLRNSTHTCHALFPFFNENMWADSSRLDRGVLVKRLVDKGADVPKKTESLAFAARRQNLALLKLLLDREVDINVKLKPYGKSQWTFCTMHYRVEGTWRCDDVTFRDIAKTARENIRKVKWLLERGADAHANNNQALRMAVEYGDLNLARLLLEWGAAIHADYYAALRSAVQKNNEAMVRLLLENGADINDDEALFTAVRNESPSLIYYLLASGANVEAQSDRALMRAAALGTSISFGFFWSLGPISTIMKVMPLSTLQLSGTPTCAAAGSGHANIVQMLLDFGVDVEAFDNESLWMAAEDGHQDTDDKPLRLATKSRNWRLVRFLLEKGASVHAMDDAAFRTAVSSGSAKIVKLLLDHGANVHANNNEALRTATSHQRTDLVELLLENGADVHVHDDEPLRTAFERRKWDMVELLMEYGADIHFNNEKILREAASSGKWLGVGLVEEILRREANAGADLHVENDEPLLTAASHGYIDLVNMLMENGASIGANNNEALRTAVGRGNLALVERLLEWEADVTDNKSEAIRKVVELGNVELVEMLLGKGADVRVNNDTPLGRSLAYLDPDLRMVKVLLDAGSNIHVSADVPLRLAAWRGDLDLVDLLIDYGSDIHADNLNNGALRKAVSRGHVQMAQKLLQFKADVHAINEEDICNAVQRGKVEKVELLLWWGADVDLNNNMVLHKAVESGNLRIVELLLQSGVKIHNRDKGERAIATQFTPRHATLEPTAPAPPGAPYGVQSQQSWPAAAAPPPQSSYYPQDAYTAYYLAAASAASTTGTASTAEPPPPPPGATSATSYTSYYSPQPAPAPQPTPNPSTGSSTPWSSPSAASTATATTAAAAAAAADYMQQLLQHYLQYYQSQGYDYAVAYQYAYSAAATALASVTSSPSGSPGVAPSSTTTAQTAPAPPSTTAPLSYAAAAKSSLSTPASASRPSKPPSTTTVSASSVSASPGKAKTPFSEMKPAYIPVKRKHLVSSNPSSVFSPSDDTGSGSTTTTAPKTKTEKAEGKDDKGAGKGGGESWPESLKNYVTRVFDNCPPERRDAVEKQLKELIVTTNAKKAMWSTDWDSMPLPALCQAGGGASRSPSPPLTNKKRKKLHKLAPKFQPVSLTSSSAPNSTNGTPAESENSDNDNDGGNSSSYSTPTFARPYSPSSTSNLPQEELERREKRAKRFSSTPADLAREAREAREKAWRNKKAKEEALARGAEGNKDVIDWDVHTIVGTCMKLEKNYLRLTSAPDPSTVRPLHILRKSLELLRRKWKEEGNYTYICDQFKSLRQDLTVQRIKNAFTVEVYEMHARIALEKGDLGEYNQCQAQVKQLYALGLPGHVDEFVGYRILYMIHTLNRQDLNKTMSELTNTQKSQRNIRHALAVRKATTTNDYHLLFRLYHCAPDMSSYLMDQFLDRERVKAMKIICRAYRPTVPVEFLARELG
ncbi:hypothetical protein HK102_009813, partial [Quaeritorhiza haematococci]